MSWRGEGREAPPVMIQVSCCIFGGKILIKAMRMRERERLCFGIATFILVAVLLDNIHFLRLDSGDEQMTVFEFIISLVCKLG